MELNGGKKVTLNGTCQGGYICLMNILSGKLQDVCDALITNVTPVDGTYSDAISGMPTMHHDFITTTLPSGNKVANGYLLSLGMRFVAIDRETPLVKVLDQVSLHRATDMNPGKTPAALFRWLLKERVHLPLAIANMSSHTFQDRDRRRRHAAGETLRPAAEHQEPDRPQRAVVPELRDQGRPRHAALRHRRQQVPRRLGRSRVGRLLRRTRRHPDQPVRQEGAGHRLLHRRQRQGFARPGQVPDGHLRVISPGSPGA
jgi:hypothetical protein